MSDFVQVFPPRFFSHLPEWLGGLQEEILAETAPILRREEEASIRERWYRQGRTLRSLKEETVTEGPRKSYRLWPSIFYAIFGEYGTGRRGSQSGRPAPRGWRYGPKPGMTARRYSRIAVEKARPKIIRAAQETAREYARNVTVR